MSTAVSPGTAKTESPPAIRKGAVLAIPAMAILLLGVMILSVGVGAVEISPGQVVSILLAQFGVAPPVAFEPQQELVLLYIRVPRILLGAMVGAALGVTGALMQGMFRNPLAEPGIIGVSAGSALFAVAFIVLGGGWALPPLLQANALSFSAFLGGLVTTFLVYRFATRNGKTGVATLLLAGVAIAALASAGTGLFFFVADDAQLRTILFWSLGSLGGATWSSLAGAAPLLLLSILGAPFLARPLNALLLGESEAFHLGVGVERVKQIAILFAAFGVGAAVAVSGVIGFVGLVVPHLVRLMLGPDHRWVIPGSIFMGGLLLILADLFARTVVSPAELPIGIVTALAGAPFFLWLLLRERPGENWG